METPREMMGGGLEQEESQGLQYQKLFGVMLFLNAKMLETRYDYDTITRMTTMANK